ncbi:MAG TPA: hypothetical protein VJC15_02880 [Candidatus Paceibacterota bacterium]
MVTQILEFLSKINSPELQGWLFPWIQIPFVFVIICFLIFIFLGVFRTPYLRLSMAGDAVELLTYRPYGFPKMRRRWQKIMRRLDTGNESEYKLSIIEADGLLDDMLKKMNLPGETVDDRIQRITPLMIENVAELKTAHQMRNSIVYDPDYRLSASEAKRVLLVYQRTFEELDLFR